MGLIYLLTLGFFFPSQVSQAYLSIIPAYAPRLQVFAANVRVCILIQRIPQLLRDNTIQAYLAYKGHNRSTLKPKHSKVSCPLLHTTRMIVSFSHLCSLQHETRPYAHTANSNHTSNVLNAASGIFEPATSLRDYTSQVSILLFGSGSYHTLFSART